MRVLVLTSFVLLFIAQSARPQVPDDKLIVPGQRIGKWTLEMTMDTLLQMNGPQSVPRVVGASAIVPMAVYMPDSSSEIWWHWWFDLGFSAATRGRDAQRIEYIFANREDYKTDKGLAPGVTREVVESAYGRPTVVTQAGAGAQAGKVARMIYDAVGLAVTFRPDGTAWHVFVFRPGTARTLWNF